MAACSRSGQGDEPDAGAGGAPAGTGGGAAGMGAGAAGTAGGAAGTGGGAGVAIDATTFPDTPAGAFWTAQNLPGTSREAVTVEFMRDVYAGASTADTETTQYVRCVR